MTHTKAVMTDEEVDQRVAELAEKLLRGDYSISTHMELVGEASQLLKPHSEGRSNVGQIYDKIEAYAEKHFKERLAEMRKAPPTMNLVQHLVFLRSKRR